MGLRNDPQGVSVANIDEVVNRNLAMTGEPIIGTNKMIYDDTAGPGALDARPMPVPKGMSARQHAVHDITRLPYDP